MVLSDSAKVDAFAPDHFLNVNLCISGLSKKKKKNHVFPATLPDMYERTITIGSAGKAFSATGWKLGWSVGPTELLEPLRRIHQNCVFTCCTPIQVYFIRVFSGILWWNIRIFRAPSCDF